MRTTTGRGLLSYVLVALALWPWPLFRILHVESSAVIAFAAFFIAGLSELPHLGRSGALRRALITQLLLLLVPWLMLTATLVWAPNCAYGTGLVYFIFFVAPSAVFGVSIAFLIRQTRIRRGRLTLILVGLLIAIGGVVYDLGFHPQFFTLNHVFGGVMGPIYDEEFDFRWGLVFFRILTLALAALCVIAGRIVRLRKLHPQSDRSLEPRRQLRGGAAIACSIVVAIYVFSAPLGINSPEWYIQRELGSALEIEDFTLFYDESRLDSDAVEQIAYLLAFHQDKLDALFGEVDRDRIHVYLYPDPFTRERLTGARFTNVAPVWLQQPQMHVLDSESRRVFTHELVHIYAREFGLPLLNASPSVGLVEGLAVALEAPAGGPSAHDQMLASLVRQSSEDQQARAEDVVARLSPLGFWGGRGAVSYTSAGSFIQFLIDEYDADRVRRVYRDGRFERAFGQSADELADEWLTFLRSRRIVSAAAGPTSRRRFSVPSLFERRCPHYATPPRRNYVSALRAMAEQDTSLALTHAEAAWQMDTTLSAAASLATRLYFEKGDYEAVVDGVAGAAASTLGPTTTLRLADARLLMGDKVEADSLYRFVLETAPHSARAFRAQVILRRRLLDHPVILHAWLSGAVDVDFASETMEDSIAVAIVNLREGRFDDALTMVPLPSGEPGPVHLNEEELLLDLLKLQIMEASSESAGRFEDAANAVAATVEASLAAGDIDAARAARYRHSFYLWLADRVQ